MYVETRYSTFDAAFPADQYTDQANIAFNEKKYDRALYFYDQALKTVPFDKSNLYNRGICKKMLGNLKGACEDWQTIRKLGSKEVDALLEKYCH